MTTTSYPAVGTNGLSESQWSVLFGDTDGIVEDYHTNGVPAFEPTVSGDQLTVGVGKVRINGYILSVDAPETFTIAPSGSALGWYFTAIYDPQLNVAQTGGAANPLGPVRLTVTSSAPTLTGGKVGLLLYRFTRNPGQTLAAALATMSDVRSWVGPTVFMSDFTATFTGFNAWPRGTRLVTFNRKGLGQLEESYRVPNGTALVWQSKDFSPAVGFQLPAALVSRDPAPSTPQYLRLPGNMIKMRGAIKRANGKLLSTGSTVELGTMPPGLRPLFTERWNVKAGNGDHLAEVRVNSDGTQDGKVLMTDPGFDCEWIDLSTVHYRAEV